MAIASAPSTTSEPVTSFGWAVVGVVELCSVEVDDIIDELDVLDVLDVEVV